MTVSEDNGPSISFGILTQEGIAQAKAEQKLLKPLEKEQALRQEAEQAAKVELQQEHIQKLEAQTHEQALAVPSTSSEVLQNSAAEVEAIASSAELESQVTSEQLQADAQAQLDALQPTGEQIEAKLEKLEQAKLQRQGRKLMPQLAEEYIENEELPLNEHSLVVEEPQTEAQAAEETDPEIGSILYQNAGQDEVDLRIIPVGNGVKEELIFNSKPSTFRYAFALTLPGLKPVMDEYGQINLYDKDVDLEQDPDAEYRAYIPVSFMYDANEEPFYSDQIVTTLERIGNTDQYILYLDLDEEYFENVHLQYPVTVDPSVEWSIETPFGTKEVYSQSDTNVVGHLCVGQNTNGTKYRTLIWITDDYLADFQNYYYLLLDANFLAYQDYTGSTSPTHDIHRVTENWYFAGETAWNDLHYDPTVYSSNYIRPNQAAWYSYNIFALFAGWANQDYPNYGFVIKSRQENYQWYKRYCSLHYSDPNFRPYMELKYIGENVAPTITTHSDGRNSGTGWLDISWPVKDDSLNYLVGFWTGNQYEFIDVENENSFSTRTEGVWPTASQGPHIRTDGSGTDLPNSPLSLYHANNPGYDYQHYRVIYYPYNPAYGAVQSIDANWSTWVYIEDCTPPEAVGGVTAALEESDGLIHLRFNATKDGPDPHSSWNDIAAGIKEYTINYNKQNAAGVDENQTYTVAATGEAQYEMTFSPQDFPMGQQSVTFSVSAVDNSDLANFSDPTYSSAVELPDRSIPNAPGQFSVTNVPESGVMNENPEMSWGQITDPKGDDNRKGLEYKITGPNNYDSGYRTITLNDCLNKESGATLWTNSAYADFSGLPEGMYTIHLRAVNQSDRPGTDATVQVNWDATAPRYTLTTTLAWKVLSGFVPIYGAIEDPNFEYYRWYYQKGINGEPNPRVMFYESSTLPAAGEPLCTLDSTQLENNSYYRIALEIVDKAGNKKNGGAWYAYVGQEGISTPPKLQITQAPDPDLTVTEPEISFQYKQVIDDSNLQPASLYLGGKKVATESTVGEGFDIDAITENLAEGGNYSYFIRAQGSNGEDKYTVSSYLSPNNVQGFTADSDIDVASTNVQVTAQGAKQASDGLSVLYGPELPANNVSKIKLIPTLADASLAAQVSYEASFDGGATWQPIAASQEYLVQDELGQSVQIRATFNSAGVAIKSWNVQITSLNLNDSFIVQLVTQAQRPTAMSMVNYSIWLRWDGILGDDETYSVYRGTTPDFEPDLVNHTNRIFSGLTQNYIYDIDVTKDQTHYYHIVAERTFGERMRIGLPSDQTYATVVPEGELEKALGLNGTSSYSSIGLGQGTAYVNVASGNLVYQVTDFSKAEHLLSMSMSRTFNSQARAETSLGRGWDFSFNTSLLRLYDDDLNEIGLILKDGDGSVHKILKDPDTGAFIPPADDYMEVSINEQGKYTITRKNNITYTFSPETLQLESYREPNGVVLFMNYDSRGRLISVEHIMSEGEITFLYNGMDKMVGAYNHFNLYESLEAQYDYGEYGWVDEAYTYRDGGEKIYERYSYYESSWPGNEEHDPTVTGGFVLYTPTNGASGTAERLQDVRIQDSKVQMVIDSDFTTYWFTYASQGEGDALTNTTTLQQLVNDGSGGDGPVPFATSTFVTNAQGLLTSFTDAGGNTTTIGGYAPCMKPTSISYYQDAAHTKLLTTTMTYDAKGNMLSSTDPQGAVTSYTYHEKWNLPLTVATQKDASTTLTTTYTYDNYGNLLTTTDSMGKVTSNTYGTYGLLTRTTGWNDSEVRYVYDARGRLTEQWNKVGVSGDAIQNAIAYEGGLYDKQTYTYDERDNLATVTDALGNTINYAYNNLGNKTAATYPNGYKETWQYNRNGLLTQAAHNNSANPGGQTVTTQYTYDDLNRITQTQFADGTQETTSYSYETVGGALCFVVTATDANGVSSRTVSNHLGQTVETVSGGLAVQYAYDAAGNMTQVTNPGNRVQQAEYDLMNRVVKTSIPDTSLGTIQSTATYDYLGNKLTETDALGNTTRYTYDAYSRPLTVTQTVDGVDQTTSYTYDEIVSTGVYKNTVTDAEGMVSETHYNRPGWVIKTQNMGKGATPLPAQVTSYNVLGQALTLKVNDELRVTNTYDPVTGLLTKKQYSEQYYTDYTYDLEGRQQTMTDHWPDQPQAVTSYTYDIMGQVTQSHQDGNNINYTYDNVGTITKVDYTIVGASRSVEYNYDSRYNLTSIVQDGKTVAEYSYDESNNDLLSIDEYLQFDTQADKAGLKLQQTFDYEEKLGLVLNNTIKEGAAQRESYDYTYNKLGFVTQETVSGSYPDKSNSVTKTHTYDEIGRLTQTLSDNNGTEKTQTYTYDKVGNRLTMVDGEDEYRYTYNDYNQMTKSEKKQDGAFYLDKEYTYDTYGNQTQKKVYKTEEGVNTLESTTDYTYDQANQLSTTHQTFEDDGQDDITTGNLYNGNGQRIRLTWNGSLYQKYYYMGSALFFTTDANNLRDSENILSSGGSIVASRRQDSSDANKYYFYHTDIRGSVTNIVGTKENAIYLAQGYNYDNFGKEEELKSESSFKNDVTFTGAVSDSMTGLYYMNARHYDPDTGRFLQQDTYKGSAAVPWTQHLYAYTGNNPVNMVDPTGHSASMYDQYPDPSYSGIYVKTETATMTNQYPNSSYSQIYVDPPPSTMTDPYLDPADARIYGEPVKITSSTPIVYHSSSSISYPGSPSGNGAISYGGTKQVLYSEIPSVAPHNTLSFQPVAVVYTKVPEYPGTYTIGFGVNASSGFWSYNGQVGLSWDNQGNIALQLTTASGPQTGTPGGSANCFLMRTNAPTVRDLNKDGYQVGASGGGPIVLGYDHNILHDKEKNTYYHGDTISAGLGTPGVDFHTEYSYTWTPWQINLYGKPIN
ncbi:RHS repeat-associated core domain-containing protein [Clostridium sp. BSD2780061688st1 E8]|uniref:RHS repeat-associated core domain-containing protein n=1 Tax=unclassified Clostridium TaxID=2614128 RepID=UPI0011071A2A|nr:RHS repeat-associated core domain-containing protein [Clostridium sp. BSD2780061688st1 E8]